MGSVERGEKVVSIVTASKIARGLDMKLSELMASVEGLQQEARSG